MKSSPETAQQLDVAAVLAAAAEEDDARALEALVEMKRRLKEVEEGEGEDERQ